MLKLWDCRILIHLPSFQVSWIRHSDSGLLAVDDFVYTTSHRIKVYHDNGSHEYRLSVNPVELTDAGYYACQVSTTPHTSHFMALNVIGKNTFLEILRIFRSGASGASEASGATITPQMSGPKMSKKLQKLKHHLDKFQTINYDFMTV